MVKIIKRGKVPELKQIKIVCDKCNSLLEVRRNELKSEQDRNEIWHHFTCPVCNHEVSVNVDRFKA